MAKRPLAERVQGNSPAARRLLKRALANPGLRSKLPDRYLTSSQRQQRQMNTRLARPITAGSSTTERDLAREAQAAMAVKYGPLEQQQQQNLGEAQQFMRDTGSFYDQYLAQLQAHQKAVTDIGAQAQQAVTGLQQGVTGLAGADLSQVQGQANQGAAARGVAPAADLSQMASNAAAVRQALVGSFAAQQAATNAANQTYASGQANVVAPAQKLQGVAQAAGGVRQAREKQIATAREKAAADLQYRQERRAEEAKTVLAEKVAGVNTALKEAAQKETVRSHRASERLAGQRLSSQEQQTKDRLEAQAKQGALNRANRLKLQQLRDKEKGKTESGPDLMPQGQANSYYTQLSQLKGLAQLAKAGKPFIPGHKFAKPAKGDRATAAKRMLQKSDLKSPVLVSAALDAAYLGYLSGETVVKLHQAGLSADQASKTLGVPTWQAYRQSAAGYNKGGGRPD